MSHTHTYLHAVYLQIYDLKGSTRNRHVQSTGRENEVLLDENLVESMLSDKLAEFDSNDHLKLLIFHLFIFENTLSVSFEVHSITTASSWPTSMSWTIP